MNNKKKTKTKKSMKTSDKIFSTSGCAQDHTCNRGTCPNQHVGLITWQPCMWGWLQGQFGNQININNLTPTVEIFWREPKYTEKC